MALDGDSGRRVVGIRELRADLAGFVRRAQSGERIVVSVSGQPVASLAPIQSAATTASIDDLVATGLVVPPRRLGTYRPKTQVAVWAGTRVERIVRALRG